MIKLIEKSLSIPKGQPEAVTQHTMVKNLRAKGQTTIYKTLYRKLQIEKRESH